jgi:hypothetical protein
MKIPFSKVRKNVAVGALCAVVSLHQLCLQQSWLLFLQASGSKPTVLTGVSWDDFFDKNWKATVHYVLGPNWPADKLNTPIALFVAVLRIAQGSDESIAIKVTDDDAATTSTFECYCNLIAA